MPYATHLAAASNVSNRKGNATVKQRNDVGREIRVVAVGIVSGDKKIGVRSES